MNSLHAAVLGAIQGFTEILPISSSAHLIFIPLVLDWSESGIAFDVALHLGTLIALCIYFPQDILHLTVNLCNGLFRRDFGSQSSRLPFYIIAGTFPAAIVGKLFENTIVEMFRGSPVSIAILLIVFGLLLAATDRIGTRQLTMDGVTLRSALLIGVAQSLALMPGVSRSGVTITAALFLGFRSETAARFSFLLSLPIVAGAAALKLGELAVHGIPEGELKILLIGVSVSTVAGYLSVAFLLRFVQKYSLSLFVWYRVLAGAAILLYIFPAF
ncbi:MAG: undecaprenyl-diphosphatase UppP [Geobacter sp.]|nr:MAG: undecaprenyl-diphosphatase UppP [Geobacter sp.]